MYNNRGVFAIFAGKSGEKLGQEICDSINRYIEERGKELVSKEISTGKLTIDEKKELNFIKKVMEDDKVKQHCVRTIHAEQNAIVQAAKHGISIDGATLYCTMEPCFTCAKMIINAGIKRVVAKKKYHAAQLSRKVFEEAGVKFEVLEDDLMKYDNM